MGPWKMQSWAVLLFLFSHHNSPSIARAQVTLVVPLNFDPEDRRAYFVTLTIGTPPQTFSLQVKTATTDLLVVSNECSPHDCPNFEVRHDSQASNSSGGSGEPFNDGALSGRVAADVVNLGGLEVSEQDFGEITSNSGEELGFPPDGVLGLAFPFPPVSVLPEAETPQFFFNLIEQNLLVEPVFSLRLTGGIASEMLLGGSNPADYTGDLTWVPLQLDPPGLWQFEFEDVEIQGEDVLDCDPSPCSGFMDSAEMFLRGPFQVIDLLNKNLGAKPINGEYRINCRDIPNLSNVVFHFGDGQQLELAPSAYVRRILVSEGALEVNECVTKFLVNFDSDLWVFGQVWFERFYTIFDAGNKRVGFADHV